MAADPGDEGALAPDDLVRDLRGLARALLPREVLAESSPGAPLGSTESAAPPALRRHGRALYVTADRSLSRLPFETLDLAASGQYRPLVTGWDVTYVRHVGGIRQRAARGPKLVVTNVGLPEVRRGWRASGPELVEARAEAAAAADDAGAVLLEGPKATKKGILSRWESSPVLYFAGHFVQDPDASYLTLMPLATSGGDTTPDAASLDVLDVRAADLSACRLVVLSGCASGAPYLSRNTAGPSFGDAFLDAGASAVIQTAWDVRDDQSRSFMSAFTAAFRTGGAHDIERALRDARLSHLSGPGGVRHAFVWAAYSLAVSEIEKEP
jgi:CHAT domain-containing protein